MSNRNIKPVACNKGCGQMVYFDRQSDNGWSQTGKMVPLQWDEDKGPTDTGHQCPNSDYNRRRQGGEQEQVQRSREPITPSGIEMVLGNTLDILAKVEQIMKSVDDQGRMIYTMHQKINRLVPDPSPEPDTPV